MTTLHKLPAVILSGGSEIVALAVAEALIPHDVPLVVISLGKPSILRGIQRGMTCRQIKWPVRNVEDALEELLRLLLELGAGYPHQWPVFATEDGGLRLLLSGKTALQKYLAVPEGSPHLNMGGLDKAELFHFLQNADLDYCIAPTIFIDDLQKIDAVLDDLGGEAIFKPALKPFSMNLGKMGAKAVLCRHGESVHDLKKILEQVWPLSSVWVAQTFLQTPNEGEASWWGIRLAGGDLIGGSAYQLLKQPTIGGTACLVETSDIPRLHGIAKSVLEALDFTGIAELEFLTDHKGDWRLIELNIRPWLQVGLTTKVGFPLVLWQYQQLATCDVTTDASKLSYNKRWVSVERLILAACSGEQGSVLKALWRAIKTILTCDYKAVYSSPFLIVHIRWSLRMIKRLFS